MHRFPGSVAISACIFLAACHTWEPSRDAIPQNSVKEGAPLRVHMSNGERLEIRRAYVKSDSLIGLGSKERIAISFKEIERVDTSRFSSDRTAVMVVLGVLAIPAGFILLLLMSDETISAY